MSDNRSGADIVGDADRVEMDRLGLDPAEFVAVDEEGQVAAGIDPDEVLATPTLADRQSVG